MRSGRAPSTLPRGAVAGVAAAPVPLVSARRGYGWRCGCACPTGLCAWPRAENRLAGPAVPRCRTRTRHSETGVASPYSMSPLAMPTAIKARTYSHPTRPAAVPAWLWWAESPSARATPARTSGSPHVSGHLIQRARAPRAEPTWTASLSSRSWPEAQLAMRESMAARSQRQPGRRPCRRAAL